MNQIITIFKKDARHLWPEILVTLILTAALVRIYPYTWGPPEPSGIVLPQVAVVLLFLVPMSWWILITRLVQSESLVGDRQFWLTRPYEWKKLLAAKVLFLLAFLYLPLFIAHSLLLIEAGFQPLAYVPGLLYNLLLITAIIILPLIAIATVTSSFAKTTLTTLGILVGMLGLFVVATLLPPHAPSPDSGGHLLLILTLGVFLTVILIQYAKHRLWISRTILACVVLFAIVAVLIPTNDHSIDKAYPQAVSTQLPVQLTFVPDDTHKVRLFGYDSRQKEVTLALPFNVSGIPAGKAVSLDNTSIVLEAPNGLHWSSHWRAAYGGGFYLPSAPTTVIWVSIDRAIYDQIKSMPLSLTLSLALTELQSEQPSQTSIAEGDFTISGIGICSSPRDGDYFINCRAPLRRPHLASVQSYWSNDPCSDSGSQSSPSADILGTTWVGSLDRNLANFSLAPVWSQAVYFRQFAGIDIDWSRPPRQRYLCPGTPLIVTPYHPIARTRTQITIPNLKIPPPTKAGVTGGAFGISN
jgi:hypothetical protein